MPSSPGDPPVRFGDRLVPGSISVAALLFLLSVVGFFRIPLLPDIGRDLGLSASAIGMMTAGFGLGRLITDLPAGRLFDRMGRSSMMMLGFVLMSAASLFLSTVEGLYGLVCGAVLLGIGSAVCVTTAMGHFSSAPPDRRGTAMAVFAAALLGGQSLGPAVSGLLSDLRDWRFTFVVGGVVMIVLIPFARRFLSSDRGAGGGGRKGGGEIDLTTFDRAALRRARATLLVVPFAVVFSLAGVAQTTVPLIGGEDLGLSASHIGFVVGAGGISRIIGAFGGGRLADLVGRRLALVPGLVLQGMGVLLLALPPRVWTWTLAVVLMGLASFGMSVGAAAMADFSDPNQLGRSVGQFRFAGDLGLLVGPLVTSAVYQVSGVVLAGVIPGLLLVVVGGMVHVLVPDTRDAPRRAH